jgi:hypothetical protein
MAMREADIGSDHELIKTKIRIKLKTQSQQVYQGMNTFDTTNLQRTYIKHASSLELKSIFQTLDEVDDVEDVWNNISKKGLKIPKG